MLATRPTGSGSAELQLRARDDELRGDDEALVGHRPPLGGSGFAGGGAATAGGEVVSRLPLGGSRRCTRTAATRRPSIATTSSSPPGNEARSPMCGTRPNLAKVYPPSVVQSPSGTGM